MSLTDGSGRERHIQFPPTHRPRPQKLRHPAGHPTVSCALPPPPKHPGTPGKLGWFSDHLSTSERAGSCRTLSPVTALTPASLQIRPQHTARPLPTGMYIHTHESETLGRSQILQANSVQKETRFCSHPQHKTLTHTQTHTPTHIPKLTTEGNLSFPLETEKLMEEKARGCILYRISNNCSHPFPPPHSLN